MQKIMKIVNLVLKILAIFVLGLIALLSVLMAYIMFAPDEFPKPFRLVYQNANVPSSILPSGIVSPTEQPGPLPTATPTLQPVNPGEGLMVNMSSKIINLSDPSGRKYIRLTVALEFTPEEETTKKGSEGESATPHADQLAKINARMPLMDDMVITILSSKTYEQLYTTDGKEALRKEILETVNKRLPELHLISVYFTEFVVQ